MAKRMAAATKTMDYAAMIAEAAYYKAEQRGFAPGYEIEDWLEAERELEIGKAPKGKKSGSKGKRAAANGKR